MKLPGDDLTGGVSLRLDNDGDTSEDTLSSEDVEDTLPGANEPKYHLVRDEDGSYPKYGKFRKGPRSAYRVVENENVNEDVTPVKDSSQNVNEDMPVLEWAEGETSDAHKGIPIKKAPIEKTAKSPCCNFL
ncbi:uncharacterized protein LOC126845798 [Adelges cooleyi]|uniref:uncharacterized protein LOC126845798 n=1 Tax=Adelges cooleyi TaxID=133065 RepID=UPI00218027A7|nr:uncharacterized protein LOC126845798 [Adelges cooleyi]